MFATDNATSGSCGMKAEKEYRMLENWMLLTLAHEEVVTIASFSPRSCSRCHRQLPSTVAAAHYSISTALQMHLQMNGCTIFNADAKAKLLLTRSEPDLATVVTLSCCGPLGCSCCVCCVSRNMQRNAFDCDAKANSFADLFRARFCPGPGHCRDP